MKFQFLAYVVMENGTSSRERVKHRNGKTLLFKHVSHIEIAFYVVLLFDSQNVRL